MSTPGVLALQIFIIASYLYIVCAYSYRLIKYIRMPVHLRWEIYPVPHEKGSKYGGSYFEELEWWKKTERKSTLKDIVYMIKDYFFFVQYFSRNRKYWFVLYPWHVSFYLIVAFHVLIAFSALGLILGLTVSADSIDVLGKVLYYMALVTGISGFILGCLGSIGMLISRLTDADLKKFANPRLYFSYIFYFAVFLSGLIVWIVYDPTFADYREFYKSVATFHDINLAPSLVIHAVLFALFLVYMTFTKASHYVTKIVIFFATRWNDVPNRRGSKMEQKIQERLDHAVSWSAPHIQTGKKWSEVAVEPPSSDKKDKAK
ncbi:MAG: hypothetical protein A2Z70_00715 [Chloroflexi bacterium RBG_13_48_17]|nr:MAG: hypothetical protein A2Z70_00715 [Chloroflexi bacterium RBG_13_48_17]